MAKRSRTQNVADGAISTGALSGASLASTKPSPLDTPLPDNNHEPTPNTLFDEDTLRAVYAALNAVQLDYNVRKWDTLRASSLLAVGILAAVGGIAASNSSTVHSKGVYVILAATLLLTGFLLWKWTRDNVKQESERQLHNEFSMYQIEKLLGLHREIPEAQRWFRPAPYIFGKKHLNSDFRANYKDDDPLLNADPENLWVQARLKSLSFNRSVGAYFSIVLLVSIGLGGTLFFIALATP